MSDSSGEEVVLTSEWPGFQALASFFRNWKREKGLTRLGGILDSGSDDCVMDSILAMNQSYSRPNAAFECGSMIQVFDCKVNRNALLSSPV